MEKINALKVIIFGAIGVLGSTISKIFGGWDAAMTTLVIFMAIDFITGWILAVVFKKSPKSATGSLESKVGWKGLCKKGVTLLFVLIAYRLDLLCGTNSIKDVVIIGFIANETLSIVENTGLMGVPIPSVITKTIEVLKEKGEKNDSN